MNNKKSIRKLYELVQEDISKEIITTRKYKEASSKSSKCGELLETSIGRSEFKIFEDFLDCESEILFLETEEAFVKGFSMAVQLFTESLK